MALNTWTVKRNRQLFVQHGIRQFLCPAKIPYVGKGIVVHGVRDALFEEQSGKILTAVEIDLYIVRKPDLNFQEHPPKLIVLVVKVIALALGWSGSHFQLLGIPVWFYGHGFTGLHNRKSTDKPCPVWRLLINLSGKFAFINLSGIKIGERTALFPDIIFDMAAEGICLGSGKGIKVFKQNLFWMR